ncbi:hypothetical protein ACFQ9X_05820 [Catenulispora yoronensis]
MLLVLACFVAFAAVAAGAVHGFVQPGYALTFGVIVAAGEAFRVRLPGGREAAPLGSATALAYAVVTEIGREPPGTPPRRRSPWPPSGSSSARCRTWRSGGPPPWTTPRAGSSWWR